METMTFTHARCSAAALFVLITLLCTACADPPADGASEPSRDVALIHATVIDVTTDQPRPDHTVLISGDSIVAVGPDDSVDVPAGARVIDATGRYLVPGLWDIHTHLSKARGSALKLLVAHGITGVRDLGGDWEELRRWREQIRTGERVGPRMLLAGPYLESQANVERMREARAAGEMIEPIERTRVPIADSVSAARAIDSIAALGVDWIKFRTVPSLAAYRALVEAAGAHDLPLAGHTFGIRAEEILSGRQASVEHYQFPLLDEESPDERDALFRRFTAAGIALVPTLIASRPPSLQSDSALAVLLADTLGGQEPRMRYISRYLLEDWREQRDERRGDGGPDWDAVHRSTLRNLREMHRVGVRILPASDLAVLGVFPGSGLHDELSLLVDEVGLSPREALASATWEAAQFLGVSDSIGTIEVGKKADLVLLAANPIDDVENLRRVRGVVLRGRWLDRAALDQLLHEVETAEDRRTVDWH